MNSELSSAALPALPALPVRRRETLEIFDTALKLYRRYFWVLIGWSALVSCLALVPFLNLLSIFTMPLLYGAVSCCVAAAVRGQSVKFSQCWAFTKPRYGPLLGTVLLSYLVLFGICIAIYIAMIVVGLLGAWALSSAPEPLQITGAIIGAILAIVAFSVLGMVAFGWTSMVPIVVCLEDDKRSSAALGRAFDLLKGNWGRVFGLSLILGLAVIAVFIIVGVIYFLLGIGAMNSIFSSNPSRSAILGLVGTFTGFMSLFSLVWNPAQSLIIAVLYLDLRVRREALDLEWTAYASAPVIAPNAAPVDFLTPTALAPNTDPTIFAPNEAPGRIAAMPASFSAGSVDIAREATPHSAPGAPQFPTPNDTPSSVFSGSNAPDYLAFPIALAGDVPTSNTVSIIAAPTSEVPSSTFSGGVSTIDTNPNADWSGVSLTKNAVSENAASDAVLASNEAATGTVAGTGFPANDASNRFSEVLPSDAAKGETPTSNEARRD